MAATAIISLLSSNLLPFPMEYQSSKLEPPMFSLLFFLTLSLLLLSLLIFSLYKRFKTTTTTTTTTEPLNANSVIERSISKILDKTQLTHDSNLTQLTHSLLLEILPSDSPKWATLFSGEVCDDDPVVRSEPGCLDKGTVDSIGDESEKKKKKKRAKKKRPNSKGEECSVDKEKQELVCLYPFTSSSSATQRKIKQQYDQLVKSHESNGLTLAQVGQFVNCLIEARNELQHKSEVIQRKFTITKALLFKADRSSFDRLRQQIYKLESEQKRLEEDAFVYNWLQQQLKLSPAYKKMLEIGECMEVKAKSGELLESTDNEFTDISFEELLAQEKKDSFWQKNGRPRTCTG